MESLVKRAMVNAVGTAVYILLVASFMFFLESRFADEPDTLLAPVSALLLFVCSAAITGFLVVGKPAMLYVDGRKKESLLLLGYTLGMLIIFTLVAFTFLFLTR